MPILGEVKRGIECGLTSRTLHIWHACTICGKERWVALGNGIPISPVCKNCGHRKISIINKGEPQINEIRMARDIPNLEYHCYKTTAFIYKQCIDCGKKWWSHYRAHKHAVRCPKCAYANSRTNTHPINNNPAILGEIRRGDEIGKCFSQHYIWATCPDCNQTRWIQHNSHNTEHRCQRCACKHRMIKHIINPNPPHIGEFRMGREIDTMKYASGRYCWLPCPSCGFERWVRIEKNVPRSHICIKCKHQNTPHGENSPTWKGGTLTTKMGYMYVLLYPDSFFYMMGRKRGKYARAVMEHRLIMAQYLGRCLHDWEVVHHKNGIRNDNRLENLELMTKDTHPSDHNKGYRDGFNKGYIDGKNKRTKEYENKIIFLKDQISSLEEKLYGFSLSPEETELCNVNESPYSEEPMPALI